MATREENLKKINGALEKLSDEELDKVAGGMFVEYQKNPSEFPPLPVPIDSPPEDFQVKSIGISTGQPTENKSGKFLTPERVKELYKVLSGEQSK